MPDEDMKQREITDGDIVDIVATQVTALNGLFAASARHATRFHLGAVPVTIRNAIRCFRSGITPREITFLRQNRSQCEFKGAWLGPNGQCLCFDLC